MNAPAQAKSKVKSQNRPFGARQYWTPELRHVDILKLLKKLWRGLWHWHAHNTAHCTKDYVSAPSVTKFCPERANKAQQLLLRAWEKGHKQLLLGAVVLRLAIHFILVDNLERRRLGTPE